jgi:hypothetical protein
VGLPNLVGPRNGRSVRFVGLLNERETRRSVRSGDNQNDAVLSRRSVCWVGARNGRLGATGRPRSADERVIYSRTDRTARFRASSGIHLRCSMNPCLLANGKS